MERDHQTMCDQELIVGYVYGELDASERETLDRHLATCAECRDEVNGLRGVRTQLASWAPPAPELDFQIVRGPRAVAPPVRRWGVSPVWGLAAAALLVLSVSAAIAHLEIRVGDGGFTVRTGWNSAPVVPPVGGTGLGTTPALSPVSPVEVQRLQARVKDLEARLGGLQPAVAHVSLADGRTTDADLLRVVRRLILESEERQQGVLARQILQVNRDVQNARQADYDRLVYGMQRLQGTAVETSQRQKIIEDHLVRVGMQQR